LQTKNLTDFSHYKHGISKNKSATIGRVEAKPKSKIWMDKQLNNIKTEEQVM